MERDREQLARPIEFHVTRIPQLRVLFGDYERCVVQWLGETAPLHFLGTEHALARAFRTVGSQTDERFTEQELERGRAMAIHIGALEEKVDRLTQQLETAEERLRIERGVRERMEDALISRDGHNRATSEVARLRREAAGEGRRP